MWALLNAACGWVGKFGDEHELLGLSFPRRFRNPRQFASHVSTAAAATADAACAAASAVTAGNAARAASRNAAGAAASGATCAAPGNTTCAAPGNTACATACNTTSATACAAFGTAGAIRSAGGLLARHLARDRRGAIAG